MFLHFYKIVRCTPTGDRPAWEYGKTLRRKEKNALTKI